MLAAVMTQTPPEYRRIADALRADIDSGRLAQGAELPSEPALMRKWQVSRGTAREALRELEAAGLVTKGRPRRVRVHAPLPIHVTATESLTWQADMERLGYTPGARITITIKGGQLVRRVLRLVDGEPHNVAEWTFPLEVASGTRLAADEDISEGSVAYLGELGWTSLKQDPAEFETRMPTPGEAAELRIPPGVPVAVEYRTGRSGKQVVFTSVRVLPGDRTRLVLGP